MRDKEWANRLGFCKRCGRFGRVHGGSGERGYSLCRSCLEEWFEEQAKLFKRFGSPLESNEEYEKWRGSERTRKEED